MYSLDLPEGWRENQCVGFLKRISSFWDTLILYSFRCIMNLYSFRGGLTDTSAETKALVRTSVAVIAETSRCLEKPCEKHVNYHHLRAPRYKQCCRSSRNIAYVTPKNNYFYYPKKMYILVSKYPQKNQFDFEKNLTLVTRAIHFCSNGPPPNDCQWRTLSRYAFRSPPNM